MVQYGKYFPEFLIFSQNLRNKENICHIAIGSVR